MSPLIRIAEKEDAPRLNDALARLSSELGDQHLATAADLRRAGWGPHPAFRAILAEHGGATVGVAVYSPFYSTVWSSAGAYVSDLWVAPEARGHRLGLKLLATAARDADTTWGATRLKLNVYDSSPESRKFYKTLGFAPARAQTEMVLDQDACTALKGMR